MQRRGMRKRRRCGCGGFAGGSGSGGVASVAGGSSAMVQTQRARRGLRGDLGAAVRAGDLRRVMWIPRLSGIRRPAVNQGDGRYAVDRPDRGPADLAVSAHRPP